ncbi:hypothetical protein Salat_0877400 [Sesamum alatum]|uniref:Uncharacterized protein n=1 Tax=Sesamum alatum TaxID=300844 RepID=A0AAE1YJI8_9LAMI|nr:hypothetical protein Salat_0877400 [Sesamum alatum]
MLAGLVIHRPAIIPVIRGNPIPHHMNPVMQLLNFVYVIVEIPLLRGLLGLDRILVDVSEAVRATMLVNRPTFRNDEASPAWVLCSTFEWVDHPRCQRCVEVIPGLIPRLSRSTANEKAYEDRIRKLEAHVRALRAKLQRYGLPALSFPIISRHAGKYGHVLYCIDLGLGSTCRLYSNNEME